MRSEPGVEALAGQAELYRSLSRAFVDGDPRPPDPRELSTLVPGLDAVLPPPPADPKAELRRVFGHNLSPDCPPYETHYDKIGVFRQTQQMADLAGFYRAFGVEAAGGDRRPDHLPVELEFAGLLCLKEAAALGKGAADKAELCRSARARFLSEHLGRWIHAFAEAVERKAPGSYYAALARYSAAAVSRDAQSLGAVPRERAAGPFLDEEGDVCSSCIGGAQALPSGGDDASA